MRTWVFLSPHFDDVVLSAGGLVWELTRRGNPAQIWTICAGDPPADKPLPEYARLLHDFWGIGDDVPARRTLEDDACCRLLGVANARRYHVPDDIYRYLPGSDEPVIRENDDQTKPLEPSESYLIPPVTELIRTNLLPDCELVAPLAIGSHRDHVLTRAAAERLGIPLWHYADYPYLIYGQHNLADWIPSGAKEFSLPISPDGLGAWRDGIACHRSQIPLLFVDENDMRLSIEKYARAGHGNTLWQF